MSLGASKERYSRSSSGAIAILRFTCVNSNGEEVQKGFNDIFCLFSFAQVRASSGDAPVCGGCTARLDEIILNPTLTLTRNMK